MNFIIFFYITNYQKNKKTIQDKFLSCRLMTIKFPKSLSHEFIPKITKHSFTSTFNNDKIK